ncbi:prepilin-type N-terminal cleavage/methylation domain-containing protein [Geothrix sp. 21YS21S-2]|uniref:type IV pilus modification PilV family protein n=1 Tax=Geothrix sp. 21YS21S-2 TaxID=3068893 RepID=UPI0027BAFEBA|nr:prepilin-type N-terminal cleavage/methylation domain-containing protein [Geothrix sp. 21YS21S-2]
MGGRGGFSLIEVLTVMAVAGLALGGIVRLVEGTARAGAGVEYRLKARWEAIGALERGTVRASREPIRVQVAAEGGRREARASWPEGALRLEVWVGYE